jgi:hypothetical protein
VRFSLPASRATGLSIFSHSISEGLLIQTQLNGFYTLIGGDLSKFVNEADPQLLLSSVYSGELLSDGNLPLERCLMVSSLSIAGVNEISYFTESRSNNTQRSVCLKMRTKSLVRSR